MATEQTGCFEELSGRTSGHLYERNCLGDEALGQGGEGLGRRCVSRPNGHWLARVATGGNRWVEGD